MTAAWNWMKKNIQPKKNPSISHLVGRWTDPIEKYARQIGSFPQVGLNIKK